MHDAQPPAASPSTWVTRFAPFIRAGGEILDLACGSGRHARWLAGQGWRVEAVDRDAGALAGLAGVTGVRVRVADLEHGPWPYAGRRFDGVVVTNYLHRALLPLVEGALAEGGVLIYETFMASCPSPIRAAPASSTSPRSSRPVSVPSPWPPTC